MINYSEFCEPGPDRVHPDNACAQQMHQKIIDVLNRHKCSGGSCECKDEFHGYRCEEDCWTKDTWCWNCDNCCNGSYFWWGASYCSAELEAESTMNSITALNEESLGKGKGKGGGKGKGLGPPLFGDKSKEPKNQLVPQPPPSNLKGSSTPGMESRHRPQVPLKEARIGNGDNTGQMPQVSHKETRIGSSNMPDIVLIGDSIVDNKCDNFRFNPRTGLCDDPVPVNPSMENALRDAGFTVKSFAKFGWTLRDLEEIQYPKLVEYAEERNNDIIIIFSGGGNDSRYIEKDKTELWNIKLRVQAFGNKLLQHSSLVINITPPFDVTRILQKLLDVDDWSLGTADSSFVDWYLGYDEEIMINYSEFCEPGPDRVHPDNACAQQMHQKIIDVLNRHKCSGGSCECKDEFHGDRCEENCWTTDTWCWNCHNCCNGSYWSWGTRYCSAETTMNSMSALNGTQFVGALAIFGFISLFYWIMRYSWRYSFHQSEFVKIQDEMADL